ncbi:DUF4974 domain-containing protein [Chitinophaga sp. SYP-B3965]|uniref:FecR family protein n=1 Tax=Chitinophaga sp. SYP-B3965 TaxID=2663120 RepID=UPI00129961BF|nr:FecR domain-containing protein [Chitinophaga sp. SYP-B3965]MRG45291.1 DUF4974 domain-containing protein [Chitinophaga sp. SYP-B3965]
MDKRLLEKYFAGTCSAAERQAVENWLSQYNELPETGEPGNPVQQAAAWESLQERTILRRKVFPLARIAVAASLLLAISVGAFFLLRPSPQPQLSWQTVRNPGGRIMKVSLPDGSWVQLNGGGEIQYPSVFEGGRRTVHMLAGEAFFDINRQEQPFIVQTGEGSAVQVLGTRFNIQHLPSSMLAITLTSGKIRFEASGQPARVLTPGEQLLYTMNERRITEVKQVDTIAAAGWQQGVLLFRDTDLADVLDVVERYYGVHFVQGKLRPQRLSARFSDKSLEEVLRLIGNATDLHFERQGDNIYIRP